MTSFCSPQRYLANNRNVLRPLAATLTPSSVQAVANRVRSLLVARTGTARVALSGAYSGSEEATYDVEIVDDTVSQTLISSPVFAGAGSGTLSNIVANAVAQTFTVQLNKAGTPEQYAQVDFEGVILKARAVGDLGNLINITIDRAPLTFTATNFSLLTDLAAGQGGESNGIEGAGMDWNTAVIDAHDIIPAGAHRIAFGDDTSEIYLQYKRYSDGKWLYHFVPELKQDVPKGSRVKFVTGGRDVTITNGSSPPELFSGLVTLFDFLNAVRTLSTLVDVFGVVANDRTPSGQAARELVTRTDAHVQRSTGSGGAATGFVDTFAGPNASTELVTATCFAVTGSDHPLAHLGNELWKLEGSVSGDLGTIHTDQAYVHPDGKFGLRIPLRLPAAFGTRRGRFEIERIAEVNNRVDDPPICPVALTLGPDATDQTITLTYTRRPSGDCLCDRMPVPNLNTACLGNADIGGTEMGYQADTVARLVDLYTWKRDVVKKLTALAVAIEAAIVQGALPSTIRRAFEPDSLNALVADFESAIAQIDALSAGLSPDYRADGMSAWDTAVAEFEADIDGVIGTIYGEITVTADETIVEGDVLSIYADGDLFRAVKYLGQIAFSVFEFVPVGYAAANIASGATGIARYFGRVTGLTGLTAGTVYYPDEASLGGWSTTPTSPTIFVAGLAVSTTEILITRNATVPTSANAVEGYIEGAVPLSALVSDRYKAKIDFVLISAGISPLGKTDASILVSGDGCWRDWGDPFYWTVVGGRGTYAPAFNNHPYFSSRRASDQDAYFSTHEFAFQINVKCPEALQEGDEIVLTIGDAAWPATYRVGDLLTLPIIAAEALYLTGGQDGNDIETWNIAGSVIGALPNFTFDPSAPAPYDSGDSPPTLQFTLTPGGIPYEQGDIYRFDLVGGHYRWRKDAGAWSASTPIPLATTAFDSGLSITFTPGVAPSFVADDLFSFRALQPWAVSNVQSPTPFRWQWTGASATLDIDLGSVVDLDTLAIALHTLPSGASIELEGSTAPLGSPPDWTEAVTWREGPIVQLFTATRSARYLRLVLSGAATGGIGWLWIGEAMMTTRAGEFQGTRAYNVKRGEGGLFQGGQSLAKTRSGEITWLPGALTEDDAAAIGELLDWIKANNDEPFVFVPNVSRPDEVLLARVVLDEVELLDEFAYQPTAPTYERLFSARLPLAGVWQARQ